MRINSSAGYYSNNPGATAVQRGTRASAQKINLQGKDQVSFSGGMISKMLGLSSGENTPSNHNTSSSSTYQRPATPPSGRSEREQQLEAHAKSLQDFLDTQDHVPSCYYNDAYQIQDELARARRGW